MIDKKDMMIEMLRQQREEAQNKLAAVGVEANTRMAELQAEIDALKAKLAANEGALREPGTEP